MIAAVTGHRPTKTGGYSKAARDKLIDFAIQTLQEHLPDYIVTGMALGWDQAIAQACVSLSIPFEAAIPFRGQESIWPYDSQEHYNHLLDCAQKVTVVSEGTFTAQKMQIRNEYMVHQAASQPGGKLLTLWDGSPGGTKNCIQYAVGGRQYRPAKRWPEGIKYPIQVIYLWHKWLGFQPQEQGV